MLYLSYSTFRNLNPRHHILIGVFKFFFIEPPYTCVFSDTDFSGDIIRLLRGHVIPRLSIMLVIFAGWTFSLCTVTGA